MLRSSSLIFENTSPLVSRVECAAEFTFTLYGIWDEVMCLGVGMRALYACGRLVSLSIKYSMNRGQGHDQQKGCLWQHSFR